MATPGTLSNPVRETADLQDANLVEAYEHGHDADTSPVQARTGSAAVADEKSAALQTSSSVDKEHADLPPTSDSGKDPNLVDWDGPDDPQNPMNWTERRKWSLIAALGACTLVTPLASSFFAPGVPEVMENFHVSSDVTAGLVVSIYILGFALGPLIIAPMSELYGRMICYNVANLFFVIFTICCAVSNSMGMLIAFRVLAGACGAAPLTLGGATIADIFPQERRAAAMAIWSIGPLFGPVIGPVCGGYLVQAMGWRWVFYILTIFGATFALMLLVFGRETYAVTLLARKAARLRKETGNDKWRSKLDRGLTPKEVFIRAVVRPMKMLFLSPIVLLMSLFVSMNYGILYLLFTTITFVFEGNYHFSSGSVGLAYIGAGVGMIIGMGVLGSLSDRIVKKNLVNGQALPEHRLAPVLTVPGAVLLPVGIFIYGWTIEKHVHWFVPIFATSFVGYGLLGAMMPVQTYLVDAFTIHAASAIAASTVLRSIFGAFLPLAGLSMYSKLGLGWGNSLLAFLSLALVPVPLVFRFYGERIRTNPRFQVQF